MSNGAFEREADERDPPPTWQLVVEWVRVAGLAVAVGGLGLHAFVLGADDPAWRTVFIVVWLGTAVWIVGSYALPDFRTKAKEVAKMRLRDQVRSTWHMMSPPLEPSALQAPRALGAGLIVAWLLLLTISWTKSAFF